MLRFVPGWRALALIGCGIWLASCAETQMASVAVKQIGGQTPPTPHAFYKVGDPYQINGVWYYPSEDYSYDETGVASWYGPDFHGKFTANGEIFDQNDITAAHRTLPMPSLVRVTNLENGRSLEVRINDRGPFAHSRIIDLSRRSAQLLGIEQAGTAKVRVQIIADESRAMKSRMLAGAAEVGGPPAAAAAPRAAVVAETLPPPGSREPPKPVVAVAPPPPPAANAQSSPEAEKAQLANQKILQVPVKPTTLYIQAGAFGIDNATRARARLSTLGPTALTQVQTKSGTLFRVRVGPIASLQDADAMLERVLATGFPEARLVVD